MSEEPLSSCPQCGAAAERQLSAGAGLLFKGNGFYITDYRSESYKKAASADSKKSGDAPASPPKESASKDKGSAGGASKGATD